MILNVYKESNMTSRDVVNILIKHFHTKKIGHTGTLDPIATGVLICCLNHDTKLVDILESETKEYITEIKLGLKTDTGDITGKVIATASYSITKNDIINALNSFIGTSLQEVPKYSAIKINGQRLYEYARKNKEVALPKRQINISSIQLISFNNDLIKFKVTVSKGTYIRSLINDICTKLNTVGTMNSLVRTKLGIYAIKDSNKIEDILQDKYHQISYDEIFHDYEKVALNEEEYHLVKNGHTMPVNFKNREVIYTFQNKYIALYENNAGIAKLKILFINNTCINT